MEVLESGVWIKDYGDDKLLQFNIDNRWPKSFNILYLRFYPIYQSFQKPVDIFNP